MNDLADTNRMSASDPNHVVICWNAERTKRSIFKNYGTDKKQAEIDVAALRDHSIDAELISTGES